MKDAWWFESLLVVLRDRLGVTGPKLACGHGRCGACTVRLDGELACACLDRALADRPGALRLLGVGVSGREAPRQLGLFGAPARDVAPDFRAVHVGDAEVDPGPHARVDDRVGQL